MRSSTVPSVADGFVAVLASEIRDQSVVATGVASSLAILAIAVARRTHAPRLSYVSCVGSLDPELSRLHPSSEDLAYLEGRSAEVSICELFDHARRGRVDTVFFGAAEVDVNGRTNMSASGSLAEPKVKFPGVAGASTLRQWVNRPVLVMPRQSRRNLVPCVQVVSTQDRRRPTRLISDLGIFELSTEGARLVVRHPWASLREVRERTGFAFSVPEALPTSALPDAATLAAIHELDPHFLRESLVGPERKESL